MVEFVVAHNPNDKILSKAFDLLAQGELICIPTDTNWVVACDPFQKKAVEKLYNIKGAGSDKHFSLLCPNFSVATTVASIDTQIYRKIKKYVPGSYTFIFNASKKVIKNLKASKRDHQVGLRFPPTVFMQKFLEAYQQVLMSTNLNHELLGVHDTSIDIYSYLIEDSLSDKLGMIIDPQEVEFLGESTVIDFTSGHAVLLREGVGEVFC